MTGTPLPGTLVRWRHLTPAVTQLVSHKRVPWRTAVLVATDDDHVVLQDLPFEVPTEHLEIEPV